MLTTFYLLLSAFLPPGQSIPALAGDTLHPAINAPDTTRHDTTNIDTSRIKILPPVNIIAGRPFMTFSGGKLIFSPDKISGAASADAANLLQAIPLVNVDREGNISIRGRAAHLLINGKPSPYSDVATALEMIQASAVDKVEVITQPSARYDASGQGGIVNIVLKKNTASGLHGMINLDAGSSPDEHAGADLSYRSKKVRIYGNINDHTRTVTARQTDGQAFRAPDPSYTLSRAAGNIGYNTAIDLSHLFPKNGERLDVSVVYAYPVSSPLYSLDKTGTKKTAGYCTCISAIEFNRHRPHEKPCKM